MEQDKTKIEEPTYEIDNKHIDESITQEIYLQVGFKTSLCVLILNTGAEVIGKYTPVSIEEVDIAEGKAAAKDDALFEARKHLESIATWRKTLHEIRKAEAKARADQEAAQAKAKEEAANKKKPATRSRKKTNG